MVITYLYNKGQFILSKLKDIYKNNYYKEFSKDDLDLKWIDDIKHTSINYYSIFKIHFFNIILFQKMLFTIFINWIYFKLTNQYNIYLVDTLYLDIIRNGCIPIKLMQWYMTRYNLINDKDESYFVYKFKNLYENCDIHDINYTKQLLKDSFKETIELDSDIPIASGSIGQVYKGYYKDKLVAIKVMHPNIEDKILIPKLFFIIYNYLLKTLPILYKYAMPYDLNDFMNSIIIQTDFTYEYQNLIKFNELYKNNKFLIFPKPLNSTKKILISSFEDGEYYENKKLDLTEYKKYKIILLLVLFLRDSGIINDFIHGDMHMGNWKVREIGNEYALVIYDTGICFTVGVDITKQFYLYWELGDRRKLATLFRQGIKWHPNNITLDQIEEGMYLDITNITSQPISVNNILINILKYMNYNKIIIKNEWLNLCISVLLIEKDISKYGILRTNTKEDLNITKRDVFKIDFLNFINFCDSNNCFQELSAHMKKCLKDEKIDFNDLFTNVEYKLNLDLENDEKIKEIDLNDVKNTEAIKLSI